MVAVGDLWAGHEVLSEVERGAVDTFLARRPGAESDLVWLHVREGARIEPDLFAAEIARLQRVAAEIPEIVPVRYGGVAGSVAWAVSPAQGRAVRLVDAMRGADLGPAVLKTILDLGGCLARAHALSAVHGLLGPDRVFVVGEGRYAITHFGFVRLFHLGADELIHEPYYAAPELLSGDRLGPRADIYGFGTLLYELLCQREFSVEEEILPLVPETTASRGAAAIPSVLQWTIRRALADNPKRRQPSIEQMLDVLMPFAREWEELGGPPELPHENPFVDVSASRSQPRETALVLGTDDEEPFASGERVGGTGEPPPSLPSVPPDTLKTGMTPRNDLGTPPTPPVAPRSPVALEVPDLEPLPSPPPIVSVAARPGERRRLSKPLLGRALALVSLLAAAWMLVRWQRAPRPADPLPRVVQEVATAPSSVAPHAPVPSGNPEARSTPELPKGASPERPGERRRAVPVRRSVDGSSTSQREPLGHSRYYLPGGNTSF